MGADPNTGELYTPEERATLAAEAEAVLVDISAREHAQLRDMTIPERLAWLRTGPGKDRAAAHVGQAAKAKAKRRQARRQR